MWKSLFVFLVLIAFVSTKELKQEDINGVGEDTEFLDQNDKEAKNLGEEVNQQDEEQSGPIQDDQSSDPFMPDIVQIVDDDKKELEELLKDHEIEDSNPTDVKDTDEHEADANVDQVKTDKEQEIRSEAPLAKEVKVVQPRGWRRRRRRRRRRPRPPTPIVHKCGSKTYNPRTHSCCFNKFLRPRGRCPVFRCGRTLSYNPYIHKCCYGHLRPRKSRCPVYRCGFYRYNPRFQSCCRRGRSYRVYNRYTHKCCYGIPIAKCYPCHPWRVCGWRLYSSWIYRCCANHLIYSHHFQRCCYGRVIDKEALCLHWSGK